MIVGEGTVEVDGLEWVQRQAMKMFKGRGGFIYKARFEEQYCSVCLRDSSRVGGLVGVWKGGCEGWEPTDSEGPTSPGVWAEGPHWVGLLPVKMTVSIPSIQQPQLLEWPQKPPLAFFPGTAE